MSANPDRPVALWKRQVLAVLRIEIRKCLLGKRALPVWLLAAMPVVLLALRGLAVVRGWAREGAGHAGTLYANLYQGFFLRFVVFLGCALVFTNLFRGEILERSLHYYFLSPIRRDVLAVAKFVAGFTASLLVFVSATAASLALAYLPHGAPAFVEHVLTGAALGQTLAYLGVTALACLGYGAVFLATSLFFRNPMIPAVAILGLESINFLLPPALKKISVIYYLYSLCPVKVSEDPIAFMSEPVSPWVAIPGLLALTAAVLLVARWRIRRIEISYAAE